MLPKCWRDSRTGCDEIRLKRTATHEGDAISRANPRLGPKPCCHFINRLNCRSSFSWRCDADREVSPTPGLRDRRSGFIDVVPFLPPAGACNQVASCHSTTIVDAPRSLDRRDALAATLGRERPSPTAAAMLIEQVLHSSALAGSCRLSSHRVRGASTTAAISETASPRAAFRFEYSGPPASGGPCVFGSGAGQPRSAGTLRSNSGRGGGPGSVRRVVGRRPPARRGSRTRRAEHPGFPTQREVQQRLASLGHARRFAYALTQETRDGVPGVNRQVDSRIAAAVAPMEIKSSFSRLRPAAPRRMRPTPHGAVTGRRISSN